MTNSKILPAAFLATTALLSGLTFATAQTAPTTAPAEVETSADALKASRVDFRGDRGHRGGRGMMGQFMEQVDASGDRAVTQEEIDTFRTSLVTEADASGEGDISLDEFETIYLNLTRERMVDAFQNFDADGDGMLTQAEMDARFGNVVEQMDRNGDGRLDREDRDGRDQRGHGRDGDRQGGHRG